MDQFKKLYKPILRPVRPGERRSPLKNAYPNSSNSDIGTASSNSSSPAGDAGPGLKADFAKKMAQSLLKQGHEQAVNNQEQLGVEKTGDGFKMDIGAKLNIKRPLIESLDAIGKDKPSPSSLKKTKEGAMSEVEPDRFKDNDTGLSELDLQGALDDFLSEGPSLDNNNTPSVELARADSIHATEAEIDGAPLQFARPPAGASHTREPNKRTTNYNRSDLDNLILECRGAILDLDQDLSHVEQDIPNWVRMLDEKIALLHNLKLDLMLDSGHAQLEA